MNTQAKVSMVMPCYNKVKYIGNMFDSIIAQNWDNIEIILVNNGSTDGTLEVILEYESRFNKRGFEIVIINQENIGVCAAAKAGLECITGDYICMVDSDDELSPVYVSTMVGWLKYDEDCDYVVCGATGFTEYRNKKTFNTDQHMGSHDGDTYLVERYILGTLRTTPWIYMLRKEYFNKCNIVNTYYTSTFGSHEPAFIIPILAFGGKYKYLPIPLYHFNISDDESHSRSKKLEVIKQYNDEYARLCRIAIEYLPDCVADIKKKKQLTNISLISASIRNYRFALLMCDNKEHLDDTLNTLLTYINNFFEFEQPITIKQSRGHEETLLQCLAAILTGGCTTRYDGNKNQNGRIIGYGAMGKVASTLLPKLKGTKLEPTELWDRNGDGHLIKTPNFNSLCADDLLMVFPLGVVYAEVFSKVKNTGCALLNVEDIATFLDAQKFPQLISASRG